MADAANSKFIEEDGVFGVVSKRFEVQEASKEEKESRAEFADHHSVGVLVKVIDQPVIVRDYAVFSVEAISRFTIKKVLTSDRVNVLCEVEMLDDTAEFEK